MSRSALSKHLSHVEVGGLILLCISIAVATFIERASGSSQAHRLIYDAWWFAGLWGIVALVGLMGMVRVRMWRRPVLFLFHLAFLFVLTGALLTSFFSVRGTMHLQQGVPSAKVHKRPLSPFPSPKGEGLTSLPYIVRLDTFLIHGPADSPVDYESRLFIRGRQYRVHLNHVAQVAHWRFYQMDYADEGQTVVLQVIHDPWGLSLTYVGYALLFGAGLLLLVRHVHRHRGDRVLCWCLGLAVLLASCYVAHRVFVTPLVPVLRSPFLVVHVSVIIAAYVLMLCVAVTGRRSLLLPAVTLLTAGIFLGAVWASVSWGPYWSWDAKESWALITLIVYALPLHERLLPWFADERHFRWYAALALASIAMTYLGVNYLLGGMHSYAP